MALCDNFLKSDVNAVKVPLMPLKGAVNAVKKVPLMSIPKKWQYIKVVRAISSNFLEFDEKELIGYQRTMLTTMHASHLRTLYIPLLGIYVKSKCTALFGLPAI